MEIIEIFDDLLMFNSYIEFINLGFNQYLLLGSDPILIHTGNKDQMAVILPKLKELLEDKPLSYVFISHFEADECGGLSLLMESYPNVKPICSQVTARQLMGFGIAADCIIKTPGDTLETNDFSLKFISYPSEMHLWEGLMVFEEKRGLLFSSDLFIRFGKLNESIVNSNLDEEIKSITEEKIPGLDAIKILQKDIKNLPVRFIVPGHGPCLKV